LPWVFWSREHCSGWCVQSWFARPIAKGWKP